ncbi:MAG: hypothetical protein ACM31C_03820 [Acidobacteriota bacterium]
MRCTWGLALVAIVACKHAPTPGDRVPHTTVPIELDGEWKEADWSGHAARHQFLGDDGQLARPYSEVRFLRDDTTLYVGLYAADENIQSATDAFDVAIGALSLRVDATGKVTPPHDGVRAAIDSDGTLDNPQDFDEEWVIELAIPLDALALAPGKPVQAKASRCDVTKDGEKRCGAWAGPLVVK